MISNQARGDFNSVPLYRLERVSHTVLWIKSRPGRMLLANTLHQLFPGGVGVCTDTCRLMAFVNPAGNLRELPQPWPRYPIHTMVNNPNAVEHSEKECQCLDFWDPEVGGPWRLRGRQDHHPFCVFRDGAALDRYVHFVQLKRVPDRPDAWIRSLNQ